MLYRGDLMGYRIDYQSVVKEKKTGSRRYGLAILLSCLLALLLMNTVLKEQRAMVFQILFPGDAALTMASLDHLLTQLKAGIPFAQAFQTFCQQVIAG